MQSETTSMAIKSRRSIFQTLASPPSSHNYLTSHGLLGAPTLCSKILQPIACQPASIHPWKIDPTVITASHLRKQTSQCLAHRNMTMETANNQSSKQDSRNLPVGSLAPICSYLRPPPYTEPPNQLSSDVRTVRLCRLGNQPIHSLINPQISIHSSIRKIHSLPHPIIHESATFIHHPSVHL